MAEVFGMKKDGEKILGDICSFLESSVYPISRKGSEVSGQGFSVVFLKNISKKNGRSGEAQSLTLTVYDNHLCAVLSEACAAAFYDREPVAVVNDNEKSCRQLIWRARFGGAVENVPITTALKMSTGVGVNNLSPKEGSCAFF